MTKTKNPYDITLDLWSDIELAPRDGTLLWLFDPQLVKHDRTIEDPKYPRAYGCRLGCFRSGVEQWRYEDQDMRTIIMELNYGANPTLFQLVPESPRRVKK